MNSLSHLDRKNIEMSNKKRVIECDDVIITFPFGNSWVELFVLLSFVIGLVNNN